jgi:glutamate-1-semialdehyde 2,1-aminomutase
VATARGSDTATYARFFHAMLERGIYLAPAPLEAIFVSLAHTEHDIATTLQDADEACAAL